jgi:hypothetical protein
MPPTGSGRIAAGSEDQSSRQSERAEHRGNVAIDVLAIKPGVCTLPRLVAEMASAATVRK